MYVEIYKRYLKDVLEIKYRIFKNNRASFPLPPI